MILLVALLLTVDTVRVQEIADSNLADVAAAAYDDSLSTVYYNPIIMKRVGPALSMFFMTHEYGHIALKHTRNAEILVGVREFRYSLQQKELDADCWATKQLEDEHPEAILAAMRFFSKLGNVSFDKEHPTGATRAANILSCMK